MIPFLAALTVIAIAELGDKTQFLTFGFAACYPFWEVIAAVACASGLLMAIAVIFGEFINYYISPGFVQLLAGTLFILFGLWTIWGKEKDEEEQKEDKAEAKGPRPKAFTIVFLAFLLAELGDKTQLATFALSAKYGSPIQVWLGATLGMVLVNSISVLAGGWLKGRISEKVLKYVGAAVFIVFGIVTLSGR